MKLSMDNVPNFYGQTVTKKRDVFCFTFKGSASTSTLDQITLPPEMGTNANKGSGLTYNFGEWLKRAGRDWEFQSDEQICRLAVEYFNETRNQYDDQERLFDRMATKDEVPK